MTGGNRGIRRAISLELSKKDYFICINYRNDENSAIEVINEIHLNGGTGSLIKADISKEEDIIKLFKEIDKIDGKLVGLINNAGVLEAQSDLANMPLERIKKTFDTNVFGTFACSKEAINRMSINQNGLGGSIINISSGASKSGSPNQYIDYASSKGAIDTFTIGLAKEVASIGIRVNAIRPGFIKTEIHKTPNRLDDVKKLIPMQRIGEPIEIAKAVVWLISEEASYTSGALIDIAGGK
ncbi:SDR family oxidoreductase [Wenyingzhuangia sp. IMCC45533]